MVQASFQAKLEKKELVFFGSRCSLTRLSLEHFSRHDGEHIYIFLAKRRASSTSCGFPEYELAQPQGGSSAFRGALIDFVDHVTGLSRRRRPSGLNVVVRRSV